MRVQSEASAWQRGGQLVALILALSVLFVPATGFSWLAGALGFVLAGLPLLLAEQALGVRAKLSGIAGMQALTRESDAPRGWRFLAYGSLAVSVAMSAVLALAGGLLATQALQALWSPLTSSLHLSVNAMPAGITLWPVMTLLTLLVALGRSVRSVPMQLWLLVAVVLLALLALQMLNHQVMPLQTDLDLLAGLPNAGPMQSSLLAGALLGAGGMGALSALRLQYGELKSPMALTALLLLIGLGLLALHFDGWSAAVALLGVVLTQLGLSASLAPALAEARQRKLPALVAPLAVIIPVTLLAESVWLWGSVATLSLLIELVAYGLVLNLFVLSIYTGWVMKVSHLRKAVNLSSEPLYSLLRIALRWLAPITLVVAVAKAQGLL